MRVYDIVTPFNYSQTHSVVAANAGDAEKAFLREYPGTKILEIKMHAEYVIVAIKEADHAD